MLTSIVPNDAEIFAVRAGFAAVWADWAYRPIQSRIVGCDIAARPAIANDVVTLEYSGRAAGCTSKKYSCLNRLTMPDRLPGKILEFHYSVLPCNTTDRIISTQNRISIIALPQIRCVRLACF
jgi:hypothetical protein